MAKDMLFATLDPTMRAVQLEDGPEVILSDTVLAANLVVHVRDISHDNTEEQARDVREILSSLGMPDDTPQLEVWNKIDLLDDSARDAALIRADRDPGIIAMSAVSGEGMDAFLTAVTKALDAEKMVDELSLAFADGKQRAWLFDQGVVENEAQTETGFDLTVRWTACSKSAVCQTLGQRLKRAGTSSTRLTSPSQATDPLSRSTVKTRLLVTSGMRCRSWWPHVSCHSEKCAARLACCQRQQHTRSDTSTAGNAARCVARKSLRPLADNVFPIPSA
ncbi:GTPase HflX [Nymphon striatum]|nr:GTPase HflX [Nymphon striatum]